MADLGMSSADLYGVHVTRSQALLWKGPMLLNALEALYKEDHVCAALVMWVMAKSPGYCQSIAGLSMAIFSDDHTKEAIQHARKLHDIRRQEVDELNKSPSHSSS